MSIEAVVRWPRPAAFCPRCGAATEAQQRAGQWRPACPSCGHVIYFDPKVATILWLQRCDEVEGEQVLLVKRAIDPGAGCWALPGGFVDAGEGATTAARREAREELSVSVELLGLLAIFGREEYPESDEGMADITIVFRARISEGELQARDDAAEFAWFTKEERPPLVFYPTKTLVHGWRRGKLVPYHA